MTKQFIFSFSLVCFTAFKLFSQDIDFENKLLDQQKNSEFSKLGSTNNSINLVDIDTENLAVGLRLGDPTGITVKKYIGDNALQINIGRSHVYVGRNWHNRRFNDWNGINPNYFNVQYIGHRNVLPLSIQVHYLFNNAIARVGELDTRGLSWYYGFGAQFRTTTYRFTYRYQTSLGGPFFQERGENITEIDLGVDGVIGAEYKIPETNFSVFLEMNLFLEVIDNPFAIWYQNGIGARYHF